MGSERGEGMEAVEMMAVLGDDEEEDAADFAEGSYAQPESGFCEEQTITKVTEFFGALGLNIRAGLARTGVRSDYLETDGPHVVMDRGRIAIGVHPMADLGCQAYEEKVLWAFSEFFSIRTSLQPAAVSGAALTSVNEERKPPCFGSVSFLDFYGNTGNR